MTILISFANLAQPRFTLEETSSVEELPPSDLPAGILFIDGTVSRKMSLDSIGQAADCEPESKSGKQHSSMTPAILQVLPCMSSCPDCYQWWTMLVRWNKLFLPQVPLVTVFFSAAKRSKGEPWLFNSLYEWVLSSVTPLLCLYSTIPHVDTSWRMLSALLLEPWSKWNFTQC